MAISAKELPLGKVFTPDFRFTIPSFQRAYIWKAENILQLVSDLDDACKSPGTPYFLGSLILVREGDNRYDVIDGQQRLVSLSIIIAVLRDLERDPDLMRQLDALLVEPGDKLRGIVIETFGAGNIPGDGDALLPIIRKAFQNGTVLTVCSQCPQGAVSLGAYETSSALKKAGAVSGLDMTTEAAVAKLYYLFSLNLGKEEIKRAMEQDLRGEISIL